MSNDSSTKNSSVGLSKDNSTFTLRTAGFEGDNVSIARWGSNGSRGAGGATKMTFSVLARTEDIDTSRTV